MGEESNLSQKAEVNQGREVEAKAAEESEGEVAAPVGAEVGAEAGAEAEAEVYKWETILACEGRCCELLAETFFSY